MINFNNKNKFKIDLSGNSPAIYPLKKTVIDMNLVNSLIQYSKKNSNVNCRICLHKNIKSHIQNMIVLLNKKNKNFFKFHSHINSNEYYYLIKGSMKIYEKRFDKIISKKIDHKSHKLIYFVEKKILHKIVPISEFVIFNEVKLSPYK